MQRVVRLKMVRWRYCLFLAMLLLLPVRTASEEEDDDDPDDENDDNDNEGDDEDEAIEKTDPRDRAAGRRAPSVAVTVPQSAATRTIPRRPLECYVCAYKAETQLRSCLDPSKHRVHTMTCHNLDEKCFTSVISKGNNYEAIMRGCRSGCVGSPEVTCCELNHCNNQAFALPVVAPRALTTSKSTKAIPQTVLFFVTVLLVLQTVVKVAVV